MSKPHVEQFDLNTPLFQYILETWKSNNYFNSRLK